LEEGILGVILVNAQIQVAPSKYMLESKFFRLKQGNGGAITNGTKRGRLEIISEILLFCDQYKAKTNIMYRTNLNYAQLQNHLKLLTSQGLLALDEGKYTTTEKGYYFLELFVELHDMLRDENI
jgi:predicted transcriptional regulator